MLKLQKQLTQVTEKITLQDKRIDNLSINLKIQTNDTKNNVWRIEKDTKLDLKEMLNIKQATHENIYDRRNIKRLCP